MIERNAETVTDESTKRITVTDQRYSLIWMAFAEAIDPADHSMLYLDHQLSTGRTAPASPGIVGAPLRLRFQILE
jgi:hypothetical protein